MINRRGGLQLTIPKRMAPAVQPKRVGFGPLVGVRDSLDPSVSNDPSRARQLVNMMPLELDKPTTFVGRPGFDKLLNTQLGAAGARTGQLVHHFILANGTERTLIVAGGTQYTYIPTSDLAVGGSSAGDTSAKFYAVTFNDGVVYHDGVSVPRLHDGGISAGAALSNAPVLYGQPVVYYAKLFGIKSTERSVIVWSEENDATIGYETTPYSNSWEIGQSDQSPLYALAATNEALYYLRSRSIGAIRGAVTPEFTTDGTHEGISQTVGTVSPDGVCVVGERVFFIDADARPHVIQGGQAVPLFDDIRETIGQIDKTQLSKAITRFDPATGLVMFGVVEIGESVPSMILAYNPVLNVPVGVWRGFTFSALGVAIPRLTTAGQSALGTEADVPALAHLSSDGYVYLHGTPNGNIWDDYFDSGTVAIQHVVDSCHLAADTQVEKRFNRADLLLRVSDDTTGVNITTLTPYGSTAPLEGTVDADLGALWDSVNWDEFVWGGDVVEAHLPVGLNAMGRWARLILEHQETGERFGFTKLSAAYTLAGDAPGAY